MASGVEGFWCKGLLDRPSQKGRARDHDSDLTWKTRLTSPDQDQYLHLWLQYYLAAFIEGN